MAKAKKKRMRRAYLKPWSASMINTGRSVDKHTLAQYTAKVTAKAWLEYADFWGYEFQDGVGGDPWFAKESARQRLKDEMMGDQDPTLRVCLFRTADGSASIHMFYNAVQTEFFLLHHSKGVYMKSMTYSSRISIMSRFDSNRIKWVKCLDLNTPRPV